jgi:hypothetical protein
MCEILIQFTDKVPNTDSTYHLNYIQGDAIVACEDGWGWTDTEINNPKWRIIKIPGVPLTNSTIVAIANPRVDPITGNLKRKRDYVIDVSLIPSAIKTYLVNHQIITLTTQQASQLVTWVRKHSDTLTSN